MVPVVSGDRGSEDSISKAPVISDPCPPPPDLCTLYLMPADPHQSHLDGLRKHRNRKDPDLSLGFMRERFKREVQKPYEQLGELADVWTELVPKELASHTRLMSLNRGVLRVAVDSSGRLYELDRLLRSGVFDQIVTRHKGKAIRRVELKVAGESVDR